MFSSLLEILASFWLLYWFLCVFMKFSSFFLSFQKFRGNKYISHFGPKMIKVCWQTSLFSKFSIIFRFSKKNPSFYQFFVSPLIVHKIVSLKWTLACRIWTWITSLSRTLLYFIFLVSFDFVYNNWGKIFFTFECYINCVEYQENNEIRHKYLRSNIFYINTFSNFDTLKGANFLNLSKI